MNRLLRRARSLPRPLLLLLALGACKAPDVLYEPRPDDPLDGYRGSLSEAGVNTELDWGPKQQYLLSDYKNLKEEQQKLLKELERLKGENQNLQARLGNEGEALAKEKSRRAQAEAEAESLRQKRRDLEGRILSLGIEKAKLEQSALLGKIAGLQQRLEALSPNTVDTAAPPPAGHR